MKSHPGHWLAVVVLGVWVGNASGPNAGAQLAITEVMSDAATNCHGVYVSGHPDFWELTNYGTNSVDLTNYRFFDNDAVEWTDAKRLPSVNIAPGESILFVRQSLSVPDAQAFIDWWGPAHLPANLRIYVGGQYVDGQEFDYSKPGFDGEGADAVRLWDANSNLVDEVHFDQAVLDQGITFVADPNTGEFGVLSQTNVCGAFQAAQCDDIGSPGFAPCGPVPMRIIQQPTSLAVNAGSPATFRVGATGLPRPRGYQWYHDGVPIEGTSAASDESTFVVNYAGCGLAWVPPRRPEELVIADVQPRQAGQYYVLLTNGLEQLTSAVVTLTVNTNPTPPQLECPSDVWWFPLLAGQRQTNLMVSRWQPAIFDVRVRAYPPPTFRWYWSADGTTFQDIYETNRSLVFTRVSPDDAGTYRVRVQNKLGTNYADATLTVMPKPQLQITEAMAHACQSTSWDWWELTNTGDEPVNLTGYRWDDSSPGDVGSGPTITNAVFIQPGKSVILLESQTRESFLQWWGEENLPPNLQCIVYRANGLTEAQGDTIRLWNQSARERTDSIDSVGFSTPAQGVSFWFDWRLCLDQDPEMNYPEGAKLSAAGQCGVFRAANGCDLGSPGWTRWTPPSLTEIRCEGSAVKLGWKAQPGSRNRLEFTRELATPPSATVWTELGAYTFPTASGAATDPGHNTDPQRFYRIVRIAPADCICPE